MEDRFVQLMADSGLSRYTDGIHGLIRNSIRIAVQPAADGDFETGHSKIGGLPDLPPGVEWPTWTPPVCPMTPTFFQRLFSRRIAPPEEPKLTHLSFISQFNLSEVAPYDTESALPASGMLYFFYDATDMVWYDDPPNKAGWRVIYWSGDVSRLRRARVPEELPQKLVYGTLCPTFTSEIMYPPCESVLLERLGMSQSEIDRYAGVIRKFSPQRRGGISRLLGHPDYIQYTDMLTECQLASEGIAASELPRIQDDPDMSDLLKAATRWQLLFQMDAQDMNANWQDAGRIYYLARSFDMTEHSVDEIQLALQCG